MGQLIYDPANSVGADANTSLVANDVSIIQHETVPGSTSFDIQGRLAAGAAWIKIGSTVAAAAPAAFVALGAIYKNVRIVRTGAGDFKVWA